MRGYSNAQTTSYDTTHLYFLRFDCRNGPSRLLGDLLYQCADKMNTCNTGLAGEKIANALPTDRSPLIDPPTPPPHTPYVKHAAPSIHRLGTKG